MSYERAVIDSVPTNADDDIHSEFFKLIIDKIANKDYTPYPPRGQLVVLAEKNVKHLKMEYWSPDRTIEEFDSHSENNRLVFIGQKQNPKDKMRLYMQYTFVSILTFGLGAVPFIFLRKNKMDYHFLVVSKDDPAYKMYVKDRNNGDDMF